MTSSLENFARSIHPYLGKPFHYCDVGAREGISYRWEPVESLLNLIGFEPDPEEFKRLSASGRGRYFDRALHSSDGTIRLNLARSRGCSSVYEPNTDFVRLFPEADRFDVEKTVEVPCVTLDTLKADGEIEDLDFIKIDVQGAELDILRGGKQLLADGVLGVEIEVEFVELYKGQPLFGAVDEFVRKEIGLRIQDLRKYYWKLKGAEGLGSPRGQLIFADAVYFRPVESLLDWCAKKDAAAARRKILGAVLMAAVYGCLDYATSLLNQKGVERWLGTEELSSVRSLVADFGRGLNLYRAGRFSKLAAGFFSLYRLFESGDKPWQAAEPALGSRKRFGWFE